MTWLKIFKNSINQSVFKIDNIKNWQDKDTGYRKSMTKFHKKKILRKKTDKKDVNFYGVNTGQGVYR